MGHATDGNVEQSFHPKDTNLDKHQNVDYDEEEDGEDRLASMVF